MKPESKTDVMSARPIGKSRRSRRGLLTRSTGNPASSRSSLVRWAAGAGRGAVSAASTLESKEGVEFVTPNDELRDAAK
jgi:hypothetical protein